MKYALVSILVAICTVAAPYCVEIRPEATYRADGGTEQGSGYRAEDVQVIYDLVPAIEKPDPTPAIPHEMIRKNGHELANYAIVFTTESCLACKRMYPTIILLRKQGYIVYVFDDDFQDTRQKLDIKLFPTTVIFDKGKETKRIEGVTTKSEIEKYLAPKKDSSSVGP